MREQSWLLFRGDEGGKLKFGASLCDAWTQVQKWHKRAGVEAHYLLHIHADQSGDRSLMLPVAPKACPYSMD